VTGSNGKSTVVSLLYHVLNSLGLRAALGGNIGIPALSLLDDKVDVYVLEISSFQIDLLKKARFDVVSVLNLSPDHLDRYEDYNAYCDAKLALLARGKYVVMNGKQKALITDLMHKNLHYFNADNAYVNGEKTIFADEVFCEQSEIILQGKHNLENILAVLVILQGLISVDHRLLLKLKEAIARFEPLAHRCRLVNICSGVKYINDSKATNIASAEAALVGLGSDSKNIIILLGGMAKGADFSELSPVLERYVKKALIYGQDRLLIHQAIADRVNCAVYDNLDQAFTAGCSLAQENDIVLLSPGCASFDGFLNYVHRGEHFEKLVSELR
jgi:UDP-N-acetylmuramoylalanine--D-glutamate ligase